MYDHIKRGWLAIELTSLGCMFVGFVLAFFLLGERPLGLRLFWGKGEQTSEEQTPEEKQPGRRDSHRYFVDLDPVLVPG
jgi:hypothetical protein